MVREGTRLFFGPTLEHEFAAVVAHHEIEERFPLHRVLQARETGPATEAAGPLDAQILAARRDTHGFLLPADFAPA